MKSTPAFIFRECALWYNRDLKVGQATKMTIPPMKPKTEAFRNAGMATERKTRFGYVRETAKFSNLGLDPQIVGGFGLLPGQDEELMITGALIDEDGTGNNATCYMRGFSESTEFGEFASGTKVDAIDREFEWNFMKLEIGGNTWEFDDFDVKYNGTSLYGPVRSLLLLD